MWALLSLAVIALSQVPITARADETFPSRPIRIVVPYPPGAVTDATCRAVAAELSKVTGQTVIVDNKPGGGTVIGTQAVKYSPADGYTLLYQSNSLIDNLYVLKQPGYTLEDFKPVGALSESAFVLVMSTKYPFKSLQDLVAYGKAHPGTLNYSTTGRGSAASIVSSKLGQAAQMEWTEIPFKGGAEATQAAMSGDTHVFVASQGAPLIHSNPDKLRMAAISGSKRSDLLPDVPTFVELGYSSVVLENWSALFVRSDTPPDITDKLKAALDKVVNSADFKEQMKKLIVPPYLGKLSDLPARMQKEAREFVEEAKQLGIKPQ